MKPIWFWLIFCCCVLAMYIGASLLIGYTEVKEPGISTLKRSQLLEMHEQTRQRI